MIELKKIVLALGAVVTLGGALAVLNEWRPVMKFELYELASELEQKIGKEKARIIVKEAEDDERYWDQKVKSGMWHEPKQGTAAKKFWLEDQKKYRGHRSYYEQKVRDLKK